MTWSIRARLTAWYSLVVVVVLVAGAAAVAAVQERLAFERLDGEIARLMLTLEGVMRTELDEGLDLAAAAKEASAEVVAPDRTLQLLTADGARLASWGLPVPAGWRPPAIGEPGIDTLAVGDAPVRALVRPLAYAGRRYVAVVIAPLEDIAAERRELRIALGAGVIIALLLAAVGGWIVGRQSLRPLGTLAAQAAAISGRDPSERLRAPHPNDELGRFAGAFNGLLDRLASALNSQRQFMADASHELRTPVSVVRTAAQVTLAQPARPEQEYRESFGIVEEQSARLARLVDAMFLLSRAEAQGIPLVREPLYVEDLVGECARALRLLAGERRVSIEARVDSEQMVSGDPALLKQMIANLLDNGVRHAREGGRVTASVGREDGAIVVRVADDGAGIAPDHQPRIFERFVRFDGRSHGAGLGLPIARWVAEAHGGSLMLESTGPHGSCFVVRLPPS
jgi:signal transduction histidine kinase